MNLIFHHTGIAVDSIDSALESYRAIFGSQAISPKYNISSQEVNVCFVRIGTDTFLELVEPASENSSLVRLRKKGYSYYHTGYLTETFDKTLKDLESLNFKASDIFKSEAFRGKRCVFLFSPEAHLIELIER